MMKLIKKWVKALLLLLLPFYRREIYNQIALRSKASFLEKECMELCSILDRVDLKYLKEIDKKHVKMLFTDRMSYELNLENPKTFNEKMQWLKINHRKHEMTIMSDKYQVRQYLLNKGYSRYLNKIYGVYNNIEELKQDWSRLPNTFVIKTNNDSGKIIVVDNKDKFDYSDLSKIRERMLNNYYFNLKKYISNNNEIYFYRKCEWPYKDIEPCILVEEYLEDQPGSLRDYKVFCFNGKAKYIEVDIERFINHRRCFYDTAWNKLDFTIRCPLYESSVEKPAVLEEMLTISEKLSVNYPFVRVDWYIVENNRLVFGELSFYPFSGAKEFVPPEWDERLGDLIALEDIIGRANNTTTQG